MKLTKNFKSGEFSKRTPFNDLPIEYKRNIIKLAENAQAIRDYIGKPVTVTSGYRSKTENEMIGGSKTSQHVRAEAADIVFDGMAEVFEAIRSGELVLPHQTSQLIHEQVGSKEWIHMGILTPLWNSYQLKRGRNPIEFMTYDGKRYAIVEHNPIWRKA